MIVVVGHLINVRLICHFTFSKRSLLALQVLRDGISTASDEHEEDFKPTPIPLSNWPSDQQEPAGTLQEIINTEASPEAAAVPARYWEDALRHSVYLTLVRDKIDQLIAKGDYISPDRKPESLVAKEIDDHDLWDKIKTARFDRLKEKPIPLADVTILARGRLVEDDQGYRFVEDDASQNNCSDSHCAKGVKALWSVKRMKQRETSFGKYHYELTFAVTSQTTKKAKKPYENPVRTFTIKESIPTFERYKTNPRGKIYQDRSHRAIWVHKNINPISTYQKRPAPNTHGLDRIFSSLFSDEDSYEEPHRHKTKTYLPNVYIPHAKVAHIDDREPHHQKKLLPYPIAKPQLHRYSHPPIVPPPAAYVQHPYLNIDSAVNVPYVQPHSDNRFLPSNVIKTTRPAVLPTPITNYPLLKESTIEVPVKTRLNTTEYTTKEPDVTTYKIYQHQKQSPMKISYVTDHIRPPVYNAPPGIFVTMDKKPFKPMPPLKYSHFNKPQKATFPDFRPSPQVLDTQFSEHDSSADTAFRPITMNITDVSGFNDEDIISKKTIKNVRKPGAAKKPAKKHENIKSTRFTTVTPEIITAASITTHDGDDDDEMEWANILGAFTKTTPMASHKEQSTKANIDPIISTTPLSTTTKDYFFTTQENFAEAYEEEVPSTSSKTSQSSTTSTTTQKPKKRTRPPPKFNKPEKIKKPKRVTSTSTTTLKPTPKSPINKNIDDLTPQASSAATSATNSIRDTKTQRAPASTTTSSTTPRPTTTMKLTTASTSSTTTTASTFSTTTTSSPTVDTEQPVATTQPKSKNRFRQSTLMHKGTSVNHDKWSASTLDKNRTNTATSNVYALRRKASKFTGYIPASTPRRPEVERDREDHRDHVYNDKKSSNTTEIVGDDYNSNKETISSTTETLEEDILVKKVPPTLPTYEDQEMREEPPAEHDDELEQEEENGETELEHKEISKDVQETKDDNEYIFPNTSVIQEVKQYIGLDDQTATTELTIVASPYSATKNKTKCKKKKHNNLITAEAIKSSIERGATDTPKTSSTTSTTASPVTPDIFNELFGGFTMDDTIDKPEKERPTSVPEQNPSESENHERYLHLDDDLEDFLHSLDEKSNSHDDKADEEYDDESDEKGSPFNIQENSKQFNDDYYEDADDAQDAEESQEHPFSLLDLMDME